MVNDKASGFFQYAAVDDSAEYRACNSVVSTAWYTKLSERHGTVNLAISETNTAFASDRYYELAINTDDNNVQLRRVADGNRWVSVVNEQYNNRRRAVPISTSTVPRYFQLGSVLRVITYLILLLKNKY